ncbi:internal scaffolding protein [Dipodfec virus UOA04_Rod_819]|nr:internal scaffolding protein [Dipodfec virus UOA04_Rod_819]
MAEKLLDVVPTKYVSQFYNSRRQPAKVVLTSSKPSKTQISPLDCGSPQEVLEKHGMYKDQTLYEKHPEKMYLDLTELGDYQSNLQAVIDCKDKFMALDPDVRNQFGNDVMKFVEHVSKPDFDVTSVMNKKQKEAYSKYVEQENRKKAHEEYINSDEYKRIVAESEARRQYDAEQFNAWYAKKQKVNT